MLLLLLLSPRGSRPLYQELLDLLAVSCVDERWLLRRRFDTFTPRLNERPLDLTTQGNYLGTALDHGSFRRNQSRGREEK